MDSDYLFPKYCICISPGKYNLTVRQCALLSGVWKKLDFVWMGPESCGITKYILARRSPNIFGIAAHRLRGGRIK